MTPKEIIDTVIAVILLLLLAFIAWWFNHNSAVLASDKAYINKAQATLAGTEGGVVALNTAAADLAVADQEVAAARATKNHNYNEVIRHDQKSASWDATSIPDSVRNSDARAATIH